jgi:hypothetical protein
VQPSAGLRPARPDITVQGWPIRAQRVIEAKTFRKILAELKRLGLTVTVLFEAATALTILDLEGAQASLDSDSHVTFDISMCVQLLPLIYALLTVALMQRGTPEVSCPSVQRTITACFFAFHFPSCSSPPRTRGRTYSTHARHCSDGVTKRSIYHMAWKSLSPVRFRMGTTSK